MQLEIKPPCTEKRYTISYNVSNRAISCNVSNRARQIHAPLVTRINCGGCSCWTPKKKSSLLRPTWSRSISLVFVFTPELPLHLGGKRIIEGLRDGDTCGMRFSVKLKRDPGSNSKVETWIMLKILWTLKRGRSHQQPDRGARLMDPRRSTGGRPGDRRRARTLCLATYTCWWPCMHAFTRRCMRVVAGRRSALYVLPGARYLTSWAAYDYTSGSSTATCTTAGMPCITVTNIIN